MFRCVSFGVVVVSLLVGCGSSSSTFSRDEPKEERYLATIEVDRAEGVTADGVDSIELTLSLLTNKGEPAAGISIEFFASGEGNRLSAPAETDEAGVAKGSLASTVAGRKTISAAMVDGDDIVYLDATVEVAFTPGKAVGIAFVQIPAQVAAGAPFLPALVVAVVDAKGNRRSCSSIRAIRRFSTRSSGPSGPGRASTAAGAGRPSAPRWAT